MLPWRHTHSKRQLGFYQVKGSWWWNRGILTEVVMRCRIRAVLSSTLPSLAQEHALHFQSSAPTIWKWLTHWKTTLTLFGALIKHSLWVYFARDPFDATNASVQKISGESPALSWLGIASQCRAPAQRTDASRVCEQKQWTWPWKRTLNLDTFCLLL